MPKTTSNAHRPLRGFTSAAIAILGTGYALWLRMSGLINTEASFFGFTCLFIFVGIVVYVLPQLQELNLKELKVSLREIKETEKRVFAEAETLKTLSLALADVLVMHSLNIGRLSGEDLSKTYRAWQEAKLKKVLGMIQATPEETSHLMRFARLFEAADELYKQPQTKERDEAIEKEWGKILEQIRKDIE